MARVLTEGVYVDGENLHFGDTVTNLRFVSSVQTKQDIDTGRVYREFPAIWNFVLLLLGIAIAVALLLSSVSLLVLAIDPVGQFEIASERLPSVVGVVISLGSLPFIYVTFKLFVVLVTRIPKLGLRPSPRTRGTQFWFSGYRPFCREIHVPPSWTLSIEASGRTVPVAVSHSQELLRGIKQGILDEISKLEVGMSMHFGDRIAGRDYYDGNSRNYSGSGNDTELSTAIRDLIHLVESNLMNNSTAVSPTVDELLAALKTKDKERSTPPQRLLDSLRSFSRETLVATFGSTAAGPIARKISEILSLIS